MRGPAYPAAREVATTVEAHFAALAAAHAGGAGGVAPHPDAATIETLLDVAFWTSLRREEGFSPRISLAWLPPDPAAPRLAFERRLPLAPDALARLAPAVERPGIHLGVWRDDDGPYVWGATRTIPRLSFVLQVLEPALLVVKYRRSETSGKFGNVAVLQGDQVKVVDVGAATFPDRPALLASLLGRGAPAAGGDPVGVLVQLAISMRAHGRGGLLLVVPGGTDGWRSSIVQPISYPVVPPFSRLAELVAQGPGPASSDGAQDAVRAAVDAVAGLTAVDGAAVISDRYELLGFGAKITRTEGGTPVGRVVVAEPIEGGGPEVVRAVQLGGTRHLSAAQFVHDQRDALALVASQDGRFTVFAWSPRDGMLHAHRVETLLL